MRRNLIIMLLSKGDKEMMAKLWVTEILSKHLKRLLLMQDISSESIVM